VIVERYILWLEEREQKGDVMAESRGGKEDKRLKASFKGVYENGTEYVSAAQFSGRLTSCELKVKPKSANVTGLQLVDLVAYPSFVSTLARNQGLELPDNFGGKVSSILEESKYYRRPGAGDAISRVDGWGRKILP
jgi:hypothetical protein